LVAFTDSRQDAAKLATGIELDHYRDLVRQSLVRGFGRLGGDLAAYLKSLDEPDKLSPEEDAAADRYDDVTAIIRGLVDQAKMGNMEAAPLVLPFVTGRPPIDVISQDDEADEIDEDQIPVRMTPEQRDALDRVHESVSRATAAAMAELQE
jgi:hypothetical protein